MPQRKLHDRFHERFPNIPIWHAPPFLIHASLWIFIYLVPVMLIPSGRENAWQFRYWTTVPFLAIMLSFYVNYLFLIPKFLFKKKLVIYALINIAMFFLLSYLGGLWHEHVVSLGYLKQHPDDLLSPGFKVVKTILGLIFVLGIAISIRTTSKWFMMENSSQKLQLEHLHSELTILKTQISPHFLFNTLNNILTLIDINSELAKQTVQRLSNLLRSILYDAEADSVPIKQEVEFLINYSNLMRLRYDEKKLHFNLETDLEEPDAQIAPLLLIPLLENVFKHGVGSDGSASIDIKITSKKGKIIYESSNTYSPKTHTDKSGNGIGLANVLKRLELLYENRFLYDSKIAGGNYIIRLQVEV
ncbi:histidine kinase [Fibrobacterales bacterium]|nr:histidine kinase [Fibrobacterales bacterium]